MKRRIWMSPAGLPVLILLTLSAAGCHHVIIDGGLEPTETRFDEEWNLAFAAAIYPADVDATGMCGGNFSRVETRQSFLNLIVATWTLGWISPLEARVQCGDPTTRAADQDAAAVTLDDEHGLIGGEANEAP